MARPIKVGLDYFSFDVYVDKKLKLIEAEFGLKGFAVIVKLWQKIYAERGYYAEFDDEAALLFADEVKAGYNVVSEIVRAAIKRGIFDENMYNQYHILTSHGIQKRYLEGTAKRTYVELENQYLLLSDDEIRENVYINGVNVSENAISVSENHTKESKSNNIKLNNIKLNENISRARDADANPVPYTFNIEEQKIATAAYKKYFGAVNMTALSTITDYLRQGLTGSEVAEKIKAAAEKQRQETIITDLMEE